MLKAKNHIEDLYHDSKGLANNVLVANGDFNPGNEDFIVAATPL